LRAAIAAEARCCAFLELDLRRAADALVVTIDGPEEARPVIAQLFAPLSGSSRPRTPHR
jgi:hypothetical protein